VSRIKLKFNIKTVAIIAVCLSLIVASTISVWAYLTSKTETFTNEFEPAVVSCEVLEVYTNGVQSDVKVKNTGNVDAYIRVYAVANFVSDDGKILATAPKEGVDYTVTYNLNNWLKDGNGFYYHITKVAPEDTTAVFIEQISSVSVPNGYRLKVQVIASAIQADPVNAVQEAWGVTVTDGLLVP
jgi:hypothetical protein